MKHVKNSKFSDTSIDKKELYNIKNFFIISTGGTLYENTLES